MRKVLCVHCGRERGAGERWVRRCFRCRSERRRAREASGQTECSYPVEGQDDRVERYREMVENGLRLFEPTPDADGGGR